MTQKQLEEVAFRLAMVGWHAFRTVEPDDQEAPKRFSDLSSAQRAGWMAVAQVHVDELNAARKEAA